MFQHFQLKILNVINHFVIDLCIKNALMNNTNVKVVVILAYTGLTEPSLFEVCHRKQREKVGCVFMSV